MRHPKLRGEHRAVLAVVVGVSVLAVMLGGVANAATSTGRKSAADAVAGSKKKCPGTTGCIPKNQPDVNKDGKVVISILSPGDTNDNGYYESFIITARQFAKRNKWKLIIVDKVPLADAQTQARNACRQHPDMVAIAASAVSSIRLGNASPGLIWRADVARPQRES